jgi:hypothetical protein
MFFFISISCGYLFAVLFIYIIVVYKRPSLKSEIARELTEDQHGLVRSPCKICSERLHSAALDNRDVSLNSFPIIVFVFIVSIRTKSGTDVRVPSVDTRPTSVAF